MKLLTCAPTLVQMCTQLLESQLARSSWHITDQLHHCTHSRNFASEPRHQPWTPSKDLTKHKEYRKRMRWLVQTLEEERVAQAKQTKELVKFYAGDVLEITMRVPENEGKTYTFRGVCIARYNKGLRSAFKIYNVFPEVGGVVQHFPMYMPDMLSIKVVGRVPARRAKAFHFVGQESEKFMFQTNVEKPS